jgi:hypothetical protein
MNGRLYDPAIARFFSPDKFVMNAGFTQDFNRYSYARNNPLSYIDFTGENPIGLPPTQLPPVNVNADALTDLFKAFNISILKYMIQHSNLYDTGGPGNPLKKMWNFLYESRTFYTRSSQLFWAVKSVAL